MSNFSCLLGAQICKNGGFESDQMANVDAEARTKTRASRCMISFLRCPSG